MAYSFKEIKEAYKAAGVSKGKVVLVKTDLRHLGPFESRKRDDILMAHFNALSDLVDLGVGTLVVQTHSTYLCNTDTPYAPDKSSSERGVLTEFIRRQEGAIRSYHPFMSHTAIGAQAESICKNVSRHCYGLETPKDRMLQHDAMYLSVGQAPHETCSYVHHMEMLMGVPYRYTKEFNHPIVQPDGTISKELFYLFVWYRGIDLVRDQNAKIMRRYEDKGLPMKQVGLGRGRVFGYPCVDFCKVVAEVLRDDIYGWTKAPPQKRPYQV